MLKQLSIIVYLFHISLLANSVSLSTDTLIYRIRFAKPEEQDKFSKLIRTVKEFKNEPELQKETGKLLNLLYDQGYLAASADSIFKDSLQQTVFIESGKQYKWARLDQGNVDEALLSEVGFRDRFFSGKPFSYNQVSLLLERIVVWCENNGFPFAVIKLDSVIINDEIIHAVLNLEKFKLVRIDSMIIKGNARIADVYLFNHLGIRPGDYYNESKVRNADRKLRELSFLKPAKPIQVAFSKDQTNLFLFCDERKASVFNGILGVLPNNQTTGKVLITGDVYFKFLNSFHHGEWFEFNWRKLQPSTYNLKARANYPFLLSSRLGIDSRISLFRKDTTYNEVNYEMGVQYLFSGNNFVQATVENRQSYLISTKGLENATTLPSYADIGVILYGIGFNFEKLDYKFNPRKGYLIIFNGSAGNKIIRKNPKLDPELYANTEVVATHYLSSMTGDLFIPIFNRGVLNAGLQGGYLYSKNIFANELFRIGGHSTLRGFDEDAVLASDYAIGTLEYRYLLEQNSYLFAFFDASFYENHFLKRLPGNTTSWTDTPFGFGTGISFETKAGIFSISYALGRQLDNPIEFRSAKVHFGLVSYF